MSAIESLVSLITSSRIVTAFTGAGVSTLSGIQDFRGANGIYAQEDGDKIFDSRWFANDPSIFYRAAKRLVGSMMRSEPSHVHLLLADMEREGFLEGGVITQNIDMLHQKAGSRKVVELHGSPMVSRCTSCSKEYSLEDVLPYVSLGEVPACPICSGVIKPDITFFGEELPEGSLAMAFSISKKTEVMLVLGSTLVVHPASMIPVNVLDHGGKLIIVNNMPTPLDDYATFRFHDLEEFCTDMRERLFG